LQRNVGVFLILLLLFQVQLYSKGKDKVILKAGDTIRITWKNSAVEPVVGKFHRVDKNNISYFDRGKLVTTSIHSVVKLEVAKGNVNVINKKKKTSLERAVVGALLGFAFGGLFCWVLTNEFSAILAPLVYPPLGVSVGLLGAMAGISSGQSSEKYREGISWVRVPLNKLSMEEAQEKDVEGEKEEAPGIRVIMDQRAWGFFVEGYESEMFQDGFFRVESFQFRLPVDLDMPFEEIMEPVLGPTFFLNSHLNRGNN